MIENVSISRTRSNDWRHCFEILVSNDRGGGYYEPDVSGQMRMTSQSESRGEPHHEHLGHDGYGSSYRYGVAGLRQTSQSESYDWYHHKLLVYGGLL